MFDEDHLYRCCCGDAHFLSINRIDDEAWLNLEGNYHAPHWWNRWLAAWRMLRSGHADTWVCLSLTPEVARDVAARLTGLIPLVSDTGKDPE